METYMATCKYGGGVFAPRLRTMNRLVFLLIPVLVLGMLVTQPASAADHDTAQKAAAPDLHPLLVSASELESSFAEIQHYVEAGFIYQPNLSFSAQVTACGTEDTDWRAVVSGFADADRAFAFFFGKAEDVLREQKALARLVPTESAKSLSKQKIAALQKDLKTAQGRRELASITKKTLDDIAGKVSGNKEALRFLGGHMYGAFVERLYVTSIMVLAAAEEGTLAPLHNVRIGTFSRIHDVLTAFGRDNCLGSSEKSPQRLKTVQKLGRLVGTGTHKPTLADLRKVVEICQDVRDSFMQ